jgi:hypothetical protein
MHMQNPVFPKVIPQVLPNSHHSRELPPVNDRRIPKPALRPIDPHRLASKSSKMPLCPPMNLITLGHFTTPQESDSRTHNTTERSPCTLSFPRSHIRVIRETRGRPSISKTENNGDGTGQTRTTVATVCTSN